MKKVIGGVLFIALFVPAVAFAQPTPAGVEFMSPIVQTIIGLLGERISELQARITYLEASCGQGVVKDNSQRIREIDLQIAQVEEDLRLKTEEFQRIYRDKWPDYLGDYQKAALEKIGALKFERQKLGL